MQGPEMLAMFIPIVAIGGTLMMIWGIRYLENKENMAMIEQGIAPTDNRRKADPTRTLRNGLLFIGAGIGLLLAIIITSMFGFRGGQEKGIYFALIAIFGGMGLLAAYIYERKNPPHSDDSE